MANSLAVGSNAVAGLGDFQVTVTVAGIYSIQCNTTIPHDSGSYLFSDQASPQDSNVQIVLKQNSTTLVTVGGATGNPTPTQPSIGAATSVLLAAGDVVHVVLSSAATADNLPNAVKSVINIFQG